MNAVFAGSFDPFTLGHYDLVARALNIFEKVYVAVAEDNQKDSISLDLRVKLAKLSLMDLQNAIVESFDGYTTDYMKQKNTKVLIRGIRNSKDFAYEKYLFSEYKKLDDIEVVYLISNMPNISSTKVRSRVEKGLSLKGLVKDEIIEEVIKLYKRS